MIKIDADYLLDTLKDAIRINSVIGHEERLAAFFAEKIRELGVEPEWHVVAEGRPNVYGSVQLGPADGLITLTGHLDTVGVADNWLTDPFEPVIKDGKLSGALRTRLTIPGESRESAIHDMQTLIDSLNLASSVTIETPAPFYEPYLIDEEGRLMQSFKSAYQQILEEPPVTAFGRGITDANIYVTEGGIPTITG